jgi:glycosyltransferase involved in cell wall biosynthesis
MSLRPGGEGLLILIPCYNEQGAVGSVIQDVRRVLPGVPILVVDDESADATVSVARQNGAEVLCLPHHLGLGGAVQAGYKLAYELGFSYVIRVDGDGQHSAEDIPRVFGVLQSSGVQMVIGSRYKQHQKNYTSLIRAFGIVTFRTILRPILGQWVYDPTSGFVGVNREALQLFSRSFPLEYPEIEALVVLQRKAFRFQEVPCEVRPRQAGKSSITAVRSIYYLVHVLLGVFVNILRYERRRRPPAAPPSSAQVEAPQRPQAAPTTEPTGS